MRGLIARRFWTWGALAVVACSSATSAQTASSEGTPSTAPRKDISFQAATDPIVVTGRRRASEAEYRDLARSITPYFPSDQPLPRFNDPVCFLTAGLTRPVLQTIGARMAETTELAGIPLAGDGCKPNVAVLFVEDGHAQIDEVRRKTPWLLGNLDVSQVKAMLKDRAPVHAWSAVETRSLNGDLPFQDPVSNVPTLKIPFSSRVEMPIRRATQVSVVLIERRAMLGHTLQQIADYAVMRALANVRPEGSVGGDTILTLFDLDGSNTPTEMTRFDREYLKGIYSGRANRRVAETISTIAHDLAKAEKP